MAATFRAFGRGTPPRDPVNKPPGPMTSAMINKDVELALDAGVLEEYDATSQRYKCVVCPKAGYGDIIPHLAGLPHNNAAAWEAVNAKDPSSAMLRIVSETIQKAKIHHEIKAIDKTVFSFQCQICPGKRPFNGLSPLEAHLQGNDHAKNRSRVGFSRPSPALESEYPAIQKRSYQDHSFLRESPESAVPQEYRISPIFPAVPQQSKASPGPSSQRGYSAWQSENPGTASIWSTDGGNSSYSSYSPHSTSSSYSASDPQQYETITPPHAVTVYSYKDKLSHEAQEALSSDIIKEHGSSDGYSSYYCTVCKVPLNGIKPLQQHLESVKHKKKVSGPQMGQLSIESGPLSPSAREALHDGIVEDKGGSYFCKVCSIPLTGPAPLNQHADSEKHRKKVELQLGNSMAKLQISPQQRPYLTHDSRKLTQQDIESSRIQPLKEGKSNDGTEVDGLSQAAHEASLNISVKNSANEQSKCSVNAESVSKKVRDPMVQAMTALDNFESPEDKDAAEFCRFITAEIRKLDPDLYNKAKRKIQLVLFEYQDIQEDRNGNVVPQSSYYSSPSPASKHMSTVPLKSSTLLSPTDFIVKDSS